MKWLTRTWDGSRELSEVAVASTSLLVRIGSASVSVQTKAFTHNAEEPFQWRNLYNSLGDQAISAFRLIYPSKVRHFETPVLRYVIRQVNDRR